MWSTRRPRWLTQGVSVGLLATCVGLSAGCAEEPYPDAIMPTERKISEEIYFIMCKRVAHDAFPGDVTGQRFKAVCDAKPDVAENVNLAASVPRLDAIIKRRSQIIKGLDQALGAYPMPGGETFAAGELNNFLVSLVPFYDPPALTLPISTRSLGNTLRKLSEPLDPAGNPAPGANPAEAARARKVLDALARISKRKGYRAANRTLGAIRPILTYPRLDELGQQLLGLVAEEGKGRDAFMATLRAAALELAEPREAGTNPDDSTLHVVLSELLLKEDPIYAEPGEPVLPVVKRDAKGDALLTPEAVAAGTNVEAVNPFVVPTRPGEGGPRLPTGESSLVQFFDANKTALTSGLREGKRIVERVNNVRSTLENLSRGLRPWLGPTAPRTYTFNGKPYPFTGMDPAKGPVFDLVHAVGVLSRYDETLDMIKLLSKLIGDDALQDLSASFDKMALDTNETSKRPEFDNAKLIGYDGTPNTGSDFWDDLIIQTIRITKRPGMLEALVKSFAEPDSGLQGKLFATWMTHSDPLNYNGAPMTLTKAPGQVRAPGDKQNIPFECEPPIAEPMYKAPPLCYTTEQATQMNTLLTGPLARKVNRAMPDVGMNRSIWQRTMSTINALANQKLCNKEQGYLTIHGLGATLKLPLAADGFKECEFIQVNDLVEIYTKSVLGTAKIAVTDAATEALALIGSIFLGDTGDIQQRETQITGFNSSPTAPSLARFIFAPRTKFSQDLLPDAKTNDGVLITAYEPGALFPLEVPVAAAGNKSFLEIGKPLLNAFDTTELRTGMGKEQKLPDGYMFANLLQVFHKHWSSRKTTPCPPMPTPGNEGCTQSADPSGKFYSPQSNVVSYEPLLYEAFMTHDFTGVLQRAAAQLKTVNIDGKDGLTILSNFAKRMVTPDKEIAYRDGRKFSASNTCAFPAGSTAAPAACDCPEGTTPDAKPDQCVVTATGAKMKKGTIISKDGIPPIYLVLDALKAFDKAMADSSNQERLAAWKAARSNLVDQFIMYAPDPKAPGKFIIKNQRGRQLGVRILDWAANRLAVHKKAGDIKQWADGLGKRFEDTFGHPIISGLIDLLDAGWENDGAGAELMAVSAYLVDPANADAFQGLVTAVADTLNFVDRDEDLTGIIQFASLGVASDALDSFENGTFTSGDLPNVKDGAAAAAVTLSNKVIKLDTLPTLSTIGRILKNAVLSDPATQETAIDILFDAIADVNRADPRVDPATPFQAPDNRAVFDQVQSFMLDQDKGLERIYLVIQNRKRNVNIQKATP